MKWNGNESVNLVVIKENNRTPPFFPLFRLCCFVSLLSLFYILWGIRRAIV